MRNYIFKILLMILFFSNSSIHAEENISPHVEAINLVVRTQFKTIKEFNENNWWHDTKLREWSVKRPFSPGAIDSTHTFIVVYKIDGNPVQHWSVNTEKKIILLIKKQK